ncbi:hypothetical protein FOS14_22450 [Skermania sp. ID1734]|uniref:hypothetical protein n=1 Tax=Skermania sp. ID1734 TaxID=2597516 RepID=UPI00117FF640|nr:hypothetical protein [Skermania sp. ID1734]TSD93622.1 hypothetical protein FOS14_22450 [Skermania sp. ID1734]
MSTVVRLPTLGPLGAYLNDHLAGATAGVELMRRIAGRHHGDMGARLERLAVEIDQDRTTLIAIMQSLEVPRRRYMVVAGWIGEKLGRVKPNETWFQRSQVGPVIELEGMQLGVEGKAAGWRSLKTLAAEEPRLDVQQLDELIGRAAEQVAVLEECRTSVARDAFSNRRSAAH